MQTYRALSQLPAVCLAYSIASLERSPGAPFRDDDCLVIDVTNREPEDGQYSLARFNPRQPVLHLVETVFVQINGDRRCSLRFPGNWLQDGPYDLDGEKAWYLRSLIVGRVVGCLRLNGEVGDLRACEAPLDLSGAWMPKIAERPLLDPLKSRIEVL